MPGRARICVRPRRAVPSSNFIADCRSGRRSNCRARRDRPCLEANFDESRFKEMPRLRSPPDWPGCSARFHLSERIGIPLAAPVNRTRAAVHATAVTWTARPKSAAARPPSVVFYGRTAGRNRGRRAHLCKPFAGGRTIKALLQGTRVVASLWLQTDCQPCLAATGCAVHPGPGSPRRAGPGRVFYGRTPA
jgi:hypothetical protein